ncbi:MAG: hypothetical protein IJB45_08090 [Clostridia bacterium]|nr:hypothetical protein [Clostridia bacterium]
MDSNQQAEKPMIMSENSKTDFSFFSREHRYEESDIALTYGIKAVFTDSDGKTTEKTVFDITSVRKNIERIIDKLTENKVSVFHLEAVIEDIIFEENMI